MTPYVASLRVYEPLAAFDESERRRWEAYAASGRSPSSREALEREHAAGLAALLGPRRRPGPDPATDHAFVRRVDGITLVCPWRTTLRAWEAMASFRAGLPEEVAEAFVPEAAAEAAAAELQAWQRAHPDLHAHVRTATWQVPVRWFIPFSGEDRQLVLGRRRHDDARSLVYRTAMVQARRRLARALAVLRKTVQDGPVLADVADLGRWLEEFHPRSLVELDYGGLVLLLDDDGLRADESAREVAEALACLGRGDPEGAAAGYERTMARWRAVAALESSS